MLFLGFGYGVFWMSFPVVVGMAVLPNSEVTSEMVEIIILRSFPRGLRTAIL